MMKHWNWLALALPIALACGGAAALAHGKHFSAGEPGKPGEKSRTVEVVMKEGDGTMSYTPDQFEVKRGEQIRFVIRNEGALTHEFMLASEQENAEHGKLMERFPNMEHDDPNGKNIGSRQVGRDRLEVHKAGKVRIRLSYPRSPSSRDARLDRRQVRSIRRLP